MKPFVLVATAFAIADAAEYFTGDGTSYTLGDTASGNCNMMSALNFATTDYAALNNEQWSGLQNCGRCAEVTCADSRCTDQTKSVVVQILDRCPECKHGDLDLSPSVFKTLTGSDPSRYTIKWKFVDCPVAGNVNYCLKGGSNNYWTAIQPTNVATGITSLTINGKATKMLDGAYYYLLDGAGKSQTDLSKVSVSLTDLNGVSIKDTVSLSAGSCTKGSHQFPSGGSKAPVPTNTSNPTAAPTRMPKPTTATPTVAPTKVPTVTAQTPTATPSPEQQAPVPVSTPVATKAPTTTAPTTQQSGLGEDPTQQGPSSESNDVETQAPTTPSTEQSSSSTEGDETQQDVPATVAPTTTSSSGSQQSNSTPGDDETQTPEQQVENPSSASFYMDCGSSNHPYEQNPSPSSDGNQNAEQNSASVDGNTENPTQQSGSTSEIGETPTSELGSNATDNEDETVQQNSSSASVDGNTENPIQQSGSMPESGETPTPDQGSNFTGSEDQPIQQDASAVGADADFDTDTPEQDESGETDPTQQDSSNASTPTTEAPGGTANCPM